VFGGELEVRLAKGARTDGMIDVIAAQKTDLGRLAGEFGDALSDRPECGARMHAARVRRNLKKAGAA
jgi:hypothetical protein